MSYKNASLPIIKSLQPGQNGTKKFADLYGERLLCVRYREDSEQNRRVTTVELIVDERPLKATPQKISADAMVFLRIQFGEIDKGKAVRAAGGIWDGERTLWRIAYQQVETLGLQDRIVCSISDEEAG